MSDPAYQTHRRPFRRRQHRSFTRGGEAQPYAWRTLDTRPVLQRPCCPSKDRYQGHHGTRDTRENTPKFRQPDETSVSDNGQINVCRGKYMSHNYEAYTYERLHVQDKTKRRLLCLAVAIISPRRNINNTRLHDRDGFDTWHAKRPINGFARPICPFVASSVRGGCRGSSASRSVYESRRRPPPAAALLSLLCLRSTPLSRHRLAPPQSSEVRGHSWICGCHAQRTYAKRGRHRASVITVAIASSPAAPIAAITTTARAAFGKYCHRTRLPHAPGWTIAS